jgi:hypothetical protein
MAEEDRIVLTSVGVDIGSSTSHLLFSRLELERQDGRYVTVKRDVLYQSEILLTPYVGVTTIDGPTTAKVGATVTYHLFTTVPAGVRLAWSGFGGWPLLLGIALSIYVMLRLRRPSV